MLPAWGTVLVALGASVFGGVAGSLLTTLVRIRHERDEQRRARLVEAADEFLAALAAGQVALSGARRHLKEGRPGAEFYIGRAGEQIDVATARSARVSLLFGEGSDTDIAATAAVSLGRTVLEQMREEAPDWDSVQLDLRRLFEIVAAFKRAASKVIERPAFARADDSLDRPDSLNEALARFGIG